MSMDENITDQTKKCDEYEKNLKTLSVSCTIVLRMRHTCLIRLYIFLIIIYSCRLP